MSNQRYIELDGVQVAVSEEVYRAFKRPLWREHKQKEREKRCIGDDGYRCTKNCRTCDKLRSGSVLSLDKFMDDGFDYEAPFDLAEAVAEKMLLDQLLEILDELESDERSLINALFYRNRTERDYAAEIGISHQAVGKRKQKVLVKLREMLGSQD